MAITFPRAFPAGIWLRTQKFRLVEPVRTSPIADGGNQAVSEPWHYWEGEWASNTLTGETAAQMEAWLVSLANGAGLFWGVDTQRCGLHRHEDLADLTLNAGAFDGTTTLTQTPTAFDSVSIDAPDGLDLVAGDRFELSNNDWHHAAMVMEPVTATAEGALAVAIRPPLPAGTFAGGDAVDLSRARVPMMLGAWSRDPRPRGAAFTFSGRSSF